MPKSHSILITASGIFLGLIATFFFFWHVTTTRDQAHLYVGVTGGNATVTLSGQPLGSAPIKDRTLPSGYYTLDLNTSNYTYSTPLRLSSGTATIVDWQASTTLEKSSGVIYELVPTESNHSLEVITLPDRALLTLDDNSEQHFAPASFESSHFETIPSSHLLHVSLPGYHSLDIPFTLSSNHTLRLTVKLGAE